MIFKTLNFQYADNEDVHLIINKNFYKITDG